MHGAVKQIPISPNVQDECHEYIFGEKGYYGNGSSAGGMFLSSNGVLNTPFSQASESAQQQQQQMIFASSSTGFGSGSVSSSFGINPGINGGVGGGPGGSSSIIFSGVEVEVLDYLISEVYPSFEKTSLSMIARKHSHEMMEVIKSGLSVGRRGSLFNSPDKVGYFTVIN